jgi:hypothetical protein
MKRMSVSKSQLLPSLPRAAPRISEPATTPLKSVIVDISKPIPGISTCTNGFFGTGIWL